MGIGQCRPCSDQLLTHESISCGGLTNKVSALDEQNTSSGHRPILISVGLHSVCDEYNFISGKHELLIKTKQRSMVCLSDRSTELPDKDSGSGHGALPNSQYTQRCGHLRNVIPLRIY